MRTEKAVKERPGSNKATNEDLKPKAWRFVDHWKRPGIITLPVAHVIVIRHFFTYASCPRD